MSDWKKTVLSDEQIWVESVRNSEWTEKRIRKEIALAQAKPAYEQGLVDAEAISTQMAYEAGKEQGRKEGYEQGFKNAKDKYDFSSKGYHDVDKFYRA